MMRQRRYGRSVAGLALGLALLGAPTATPVVAGTTAGPLAGTTGPGVGAAAWPGSIDLYRPGVFTTQPDYITCVPTSVQIMRNIIRGAQDHRVSTIRAWYQEGRTLNAYEYPIPGLDPAAWAALLRRHGGGPYVDASYGSFDAALRAAAVALRRTGRPVGLIVDHGHHAWVMTGFRSATDPAVDPAARISAVRVTGPLYPMQQRDGYDQPPDTQLTRAQLAGYLTSYQEVFRVRWTGHYVIIVPTPAGAAPAATARPAATPRQTPVPSSSAVRPGRTSIPALARAIPC